MYKHKLGAINYQSLKNKINGVYTDFVGSRVEVTLLNCLYALFDMIKNNRNEVFIVGASEDEMGQLLLHKILFNIMEETGFDFTFKKVRKQNNLHGGVTYGVELTISPIEDKVFWMYNQVVYIGVDNEKEEWLLTK